MSAVEVAPGSRAKINSQGDQARNDKEEKKSRIAKEQGVEVVVHVHRYCTYVESRMLELFLNQDHLTVRDFPPLVQNAASGGSRFDRNGLRSTTEQGGAAIR